MSIMSDRWIRNQCIKPDYLVTKPSGVSYYMSDLNEYAQERLEASNAMLDSVKCMSPTDDLGTLIQHHMQACRSMGIECWTRISSEAAEQWEPMISPFVPESVKTTDDKRILSYGSSSYGYDARIAPEFRIFTNINHTLLDPLNFDEKCYVEHKGNFCIVPPNSFALTRTFEKFNIPPHVLAIVMTKSTMARVGTFSLATPLEPAWSGYVTLEFANSTNLPVKLHAGQGGVQILFLEGNEPCDVSYATRGGKYQNQGPEIVNPKG